MGAGAARAAPSLAAPMTFLQTPRQRAQLVVALLGAAILVALFPYLPGLLGAAMLYVVCDGPYERLARHLRARWAALVVVLAVTLLVLAPASWLLATLIDQAPDIVRATRDSPLLAQLASLRVADVDLGAQLSRAGDNLLSWLSRQAIAIVGSATRGLLNLMIALFGLYYMLLSAHGVWREARHFIPFSEATTELLRERFHRVTEAMLLGIALVAALQGSIVGVGFAVVGLPNALFWGAITAIVSILPVLGSALVWVPGVVVLVAAHHYAAAVTLGVIGGVFASNIDNVIRPIVYRRVSDVHPMTTLIGAFAGVEMFGLVGLLLGPLAITYFFELLRIYRDEYGAPAPAAPAAPAVPLPAVPAYTPRPGGGAPGVAAR